MGSQLFQSPRASLAWHELKEAVKRRLTEISSPHASQWDSKADLKEKQAEFLEAIVSSVPTAAEQMLAIRYVHLKAMQINLAIERALFKSYPFIDVTNLADAELKMAKSELDYMEELNEVQSAASTLQKKWRRSRVKRLRIRTPSQSSDDEEEEINSGQRAPICQ